MLKLNDAKFKCPVPILNNDNQAISKYKEKKLMITSFLEGKAKEILTPNNCGEIGGVANYMRLQNFIKLVEE